MESQDKAEVYEIQPPFLHICLESLFLQNSKTTDNFRILAHLCLIGSQITAWNFFCNPYRVTQISCKKVYFFHGALFCNTFMQKSSATSILVSNGWNTCWKFIGVCICVVSTFNVYWALLSFTLWIPFIWIKEFKE